MDVERTVEQALQTFSISRKTRILVACSGGADSVALVYALHRLGYDIAIGHVDHMLRENAKKDRQFVRKLAADLQIPCFDCAIPIASIAAETNENIQHVCRVERYSFLEEVARRENIPYIATAHHANDQLETVLMQLGQGKQVIGMPSRRRLRSSCQLIRPLLRVTKQTIFEYLQQNQVTYRHDESNDSDDYVRNAIRHAVVPVYEQLFEDVALQTTDIVERLQEDERYLQQKAQRIATQIRQQERDGFSIPLNEWFNYPSSLQRRVLPLLLNYLYSEDKRAHYSKSLLQLLYEQCIRTDGTKMIRLPERYFFIRTYDRAYFKRTLQETLPFSRQRMRLNETYSFGPYTIRLVPIENEEEGWETWYTALSSLSVRTRKDGDRIHLLQNEGKKKVSRVFIDEKIPTYERNVWLLVVDERDEVRAIPFVRYDAAFSNERRSTDRYALQMRKEK